MMRLGFIAGSQKLEHKSKRLEHLQKNLHPTIDYIFLVIYQREKTVEFVYEQNETVSYARNL